MSSPENKNISEIPELRDKYGVFRDRAHAGNVLADMLISYKGTDAIVFAIPAGGVPVAAALSLKLNLHIEVAVVSKITLPWNSEAGYGAVAFDGSVRLNEKLISHFGLKENEIQEGIEKTSSKVKRRVKEFMGKRAFPPVAKHPVILVDDGIASGFTMLVAIEALRNVGAYKIIVAVPTAHLDALKLVDSNVDLLFCANIRSGWGFAVADAYQFWTDVSEEEAINVLKSLRSEHLK